MGVQRVYSRVTPYPAEALSTLDWAQTADVMYTAHADYPPQKLQRYAHTDWRWATVVFGPIFDPPVGATATASTPNTTGIHTQTYSYVISGISEDTSPIQESRQSAVFTVVNDLSLAGNYNTVNLPALGDFDRFVIYRKQAGVYGYIGNTAEATFRDENLIPILSETPLVGYDPFVGAGNYPAAVTLHQQRLTYGATLNVINGVWMSRSADFENMDKARPVRNDDSLLFGLVSDKLNAVTHLVSLKELMILTGEALWAVSGGDGAAITASAILPSRESGRGAVRIKPVVVDEILFYLTSKGRSLRTLGFSFEIDGYKSDNVTIFAPHLFTTAVTRIAYQEEPHSCVYALRSDGTIIVLTWEIDQQVWGWARMEIDGFVEDICVIGEAGFDRLYAVIRRTIDGIEYRFLERMALPGDIYTSCHLDCSTTIIDAALVSEVTGLWRFEGQEVTAVADGYKFVGTVVDGTLEGFEPSAYVSVGLPYEGTIETLPPALSSQSGSLHVETQQVTDVVIRTTQTKGLSAGINGYELEEMEPESGDDIQLTQDYTLNDWYVNIPGDWNETSTVLIKQTEPFPAQVVGVFMGMRVNQ